MFIIKKGITPSGVNIQIENWQDLYPNLHTENDTIGFYPKAMNDIYRDDYPHWPPYPKRNETFRAALKFDNEKEAKKVFDLLQSGEKTYMHYLDNYQDNVISRDNFIKAVSNC